MADTADSLPPSLGAGASPAKPLPLRFVAGWTMGSLAASTMYQVTTVLLLRYLVDFVGITAVAAGLLLTFSKIFDAVIDPFIGTVSDRTRSRWGRRRPYILLGGLLSALSFAFLFSLPLYTSGALRSWAAALALVINTTAYAMLSIPHLSMPAEMTESFPERTKLMTWRVGALSVAQLTGTVTAPILITYFGGGLLGHAGMGLTTGTMIFVGAAICFFMLSGAPATAHVTESASFTTFSKIKTAFENKPFVILIATKLINIVGVSIYFAILPFVFTLVTKTGYVQMGKYFLVQGLATLFSQPFWVWMGRKIGLKRVFYLGAGGYGLGVLSWTLAAVGEPTPLVLARGLYLGWMGGATLLCLSAILPDAIAHDFTRTGLRREGVFAGVYTTTEKLSAALAAAFIGIVLGLAGYIQGKGGLAVQPASAVAAVRWILAAPFITCLTGALVLRFYPLRDKIGRD